MPTFSEHLAGPWLAVLADNHGYVYPTVQDAIDSLGPSCPVIVSVVRGAAAPNDRDGATGNLLRLPPYADYGMGDVACQIDCYLVDPDRPELGAPARYAQARAMAEGLNFMGMPVTTLVLAGEVL